MGLYRAPIVLVRWVVALVLLAPLVGLFLGATLDRAPDGSPRASAFPGALALLDPMTWVCVRHSAAVAAIVAFASLLLGVPLARLVARWKFWGRDAFALVAFAPLVFPPMFGALGLRGWFEPAGPSPFPTPGSSGFLPWEVGAAWWCWVWVGLTTGVPLVALNVAAALQRVDPDWLDAGRAAGATPKQAWRTLVWPLIRPFALRASALTFGLILLDPGAPLVLKLRDTLGYQLVEAATDPRSIPRAATLALLGLALAWIVPGAVRLLAAPTSLSDRAPAGGPTQRASWWRAVLFLGGLGGWSLFAWGPYVAVVMQAIPSETRSPTGLITALAGVLDQDTTRRPLLHSAALGLLAGTAGLGLAWVAVSARPSDPAQRAWLRALARSLRFAPPLILAVGGVGIAAMPVLFGDLFHAWSGFGQDGGLAAVLGHLNAMFHPSTAPASGLALVLMLARIPWLMAGVEFARVRRRPELEDAARVIGASRRRAWWDVSSSAVLGPLLAAWALAVALSASDTTASLVLAPTLALRPIGPTVLDLADSGGPAATLAALSLACNALAYLVAARWLRSFLFQAGRP